jgi:argininosuccinate lyase
MKLWDKGYKTQDLVEKFTVGKDRELDTVLAKYDVLGSIAHAKMLHSIDILTKEELSTVENELDNLLAEIENGEFQIEENFEDIHSKVEFELVKRVGDVGKKIHTGRSRNDQVLVDLHLYMKDELNELKVLVKELFEQLISLSNQYKNKLLPGYTHLQVAMPSSFGMWFGAYAESLIDDIIMLNAALKVVDQNPLGSAAGYGSSFPLKRIETTKSLEFATLKYNSVAAQMSRGKTEKTVAFAMSSVASSLNKMAADICLYNSQNFNFISFPKELTTGSSIMPHKQNPDVFELVRAKSNKIINLPMELSMITTNLTSGYHRDYQLLKENFIPSIEMLKDCLVIAKYMLENIIVHDIDIHDQKYVYMFSVENLNKDVMTGMSFRDAYKKIGMEIMEGKFKPNTEINHSHEGSIGNLCNEQIVEKFERFYE